MRLNWVLPWVTAGVHAVVLGLIVSDARFVLDPGFVVAWVTPVGWLLVAAGLSRRDPTAGRHATTAAALVMLVPVLLAAWVMGGDWLFGRPAWLPAGLYKLLEYPYFVTGPAVLTALVPAAAGWWQRRRDRLAAGD